MRASVLSGDRCRTIIQGVIVDGSMVENGSLVESLPDRPLRKSEREALESHARIQSIMPQSPTFDSEHGEIIETAMFIGYDWVTAVTYEAGHGWRVIFQSEMEDNILADGYLRSEDLHDEHPIQQGMDAMQAAASEDDE
jgi:hypothetical protein